MGRPRSDESRRVRISIRAERQNKTEYPGYFLWIGMELYAAIGRPDQILIDEVDDGWLITPATSEFDYTVVDGLTGVPRICMGTRPAHALHLEAGIYQAEVQDGAIYFCNRE